MADLRRAAHGGALVVGVGNADRGDDAVGVAVVAELQGPSGSQAPALQVLDVGDAPERYLGPIGDSGAAVVVFVDAVDFGGQPGQAVLLEEKDLPARSCVTHRSSLSLVMRYLREQSGQKSLLLGVQPGTVAFGRGLTAPVRSAVQGIAAALREALGEVEPS